MKEVRIERFFVAGPSVRTNNGLESGASGKIPGLWEQFHAAHPKPESSTFGVYSGYDSDAFGDFDVTAGTKTDTPSRPGIAIDPGLYLAFRADGAMPAAIINAWKSVWEYFSTEHAHERSYATDFEEYSGPMSATIYIGIKPNS